MLLTTYPDRQRSNPGELNPHYKVITRNEIQRKHNYDFHRQFPLFKLMVSKWKKPQHLIISL
jgi:hypothetical protein